ncbi:MAG: DUF4136 domain-containing protein [Pseudomonadota bacterium]|nr:DUF4136 domain-containing protein [Pseudomonadota bacterium]
MLNRIFISGMTAAGLAGLAACTALPVTTDVDPSMTVAMCHTYTFAREHVANVDQPSAFGNPLNAERLRRAIEANLASKGMHRADRGPADCVVGYAMGSRQVFNDFYGGFGFNAGWGRGFGRHGGLDGGWGYDGPWVQNETRISVDLFDTQSRKPIWHAAVSESVSDLTGPNADAKINAATAAIFAKFPTGAPPPPGRATT